MTRRELLDYETRSSRIIRRYPGIMPCWLTSLLARYYAARVNRKADAYNADIDRQERLRVTHPQLVNLRTPPRIQ